MKNISSDAIRPRWQKVTASLLLGAVMVLAVAAPAHADPRRGGDRDHDRNWHQHWDHWHRPAPGYVYAPPVVYTPPPESPGINLILPIHFH